MTTTAERTTVPDSDGAGHPLAPYFPRLAIDWITNTPEERYREVTSTVVFVDISGFTKLSEGLARHGKVGAEELAATINTCFVTLLDLAFANGGRLLKFGGDALLLQFSGDGHEARGCRSAIDMRRALREVGRLTVLEQRVTLRMSVGVHTGVFQFFLVGESHRELIVSGPAATATVAMEAAADAGEIVISDGTARALRPGLIGARKGPGHLLRSAPAVPDDSFVPFEAVPPDADLSISVPLGLREALASRHKESEHRRVSLAFVHFEGTDRMIEAIGTAGTADRMEAMVVDIQRAVDRHQVAFLGTDVDRDGGKVILTAGAPSTTGDDEHRLLLAVREIMDRPGPLPIRIGVNRGSVFAGEVGPPYRRTFTVMGDAVNLAARLMAKAEPGQILATPEVLAHAAGSFEASELEPFYVKGKAKPVRAFSVGRRRARVRVRSDDDLPFVGRDAELRLLDELITEARQGRGRLIEIVGEPGVGKSRLTGQLEQRATGMAVLAAVCQRYDSSTPYHVVRWLLRDLLRLPAEGNDEATAARFLAELSERAPALVPWAPLLAGVMDLAVPETPETAELEAEFRRPRLAAVLIELLGELLPESGLLIVEDAHLMDEASADLFHRIADNVEATSWLMCMTRRAVESGFVAPPEGCVTIELHALTSKETTRLARAASRDGRLSPRELGVLAERSGGNPLFLRELIAVAAAGETVDALPDSIDEVIAARIDRLLPEDRSLLRRLSTLGHSFSYELLAQVVKDVPRRGSAAWRRLDEFVTWDSDDTLSFRHMLLRDCAYEGLSYRLRRELHATAGDTILRTGAARGEDQPELLSFHYLHAQRYAEAWTYSLVAAERAKALYANFEAAQFFERALVAGRRLGGLSPEALSGVHEELGDARNRTGGYLEAAAAYRAARRLLAGNSLAQARLVLKLARVQGWLDRYPTALRWITRGLHLLDGIDGNDAARLKAELLGWYGRFCQEEGHHRRAIRWCTMAADEAEAAGAKEALADALRVIDWAKMDLGQLDQPDNWVRALALFEELDDLPGQAGVLNMLGIFAYFRGEWEESLELYRRAQATVRRTGNAVMDAFYVLNIGEIALDQGRHSVAAQHFETVAEVWRAAGYRSGTAYVKCNLGRVAAARGRYAEAVRLFQESVDESHAIGSEGDALEARARMAECLLQSGDLEAAAAAVDDALSHARTLGGVPAQVPLLHRVRGVALALAGQPAQASEALAVSLEAARQRRAEYEAALTMRAMAEYGVDADIPRDELRRRAARTLAKLGVVSTPRLPAPGRRPG